jgi:hypothetical protein
MGTPAKGIEITGKAMNKSKLKDKYGVCFQTLDKWLKTVPGLVVRKGQQLFTPYQVALIEKHLDAPE